jgi:hypothetical protein
MISLILLEDIKKNLLAGRYANESTVRETIVMPVLHELGWKVFSPGFLRREYTVQSRRVDYALFTDPDAPRPTIFLEVKNVGIADSGIDQLFRYAFDEGVPMAVLTDGREWSFFLPAEQGSFEDRRAYKLDLLERDVREAGQVFEKYLQFDRVKAGAAIDDARNDYKSVARLKAIRTALPKAWKRAHAEPDELLVDLLVEQVQDICGYAPTRELVTEYLTLVADQIKTPDVRIAPPAPLPKPAVSPATRQVDTAGASLGEGRDCEYYLFGERYTAEDATEAMIAIIKALHSRDASFLDRLAIRVPGRSRNHLARSREAVYPRRPDLVNFTREFVPGWWIGTNIANREKQRIVDIAAEVAGVRKGEDIRVQFKNAEA